MPGLDEGPMREYSRIVDPVNSFSSIPNLNSYLSQNTTIETALAEANDKLELDKYPTYKPVTLDKATEEFKQNYISSVAKQLGQYNPKTDNVDISDLSKKLKYNRQGLSELVNSYNIKVSPNELKGTVQERIYNYTVDVDMDPIISRVIAESNITGYDLHEQIERFKDIYVNNLTRDISGKLKTNFDEKDAMKYAISAAASILGVDEKTVKNRREKYAKDQRNNLSFTSDWLVPGNLENIALSETSLQKSSREELDEWQKQNKMGAFSVN